MMRTICCLLALLGSTALAGAQEALPLAVAAGPPHIPFSAPGTEVTLRFDAALPARLQVVRLARTSDASGWHMAETVRADGTPGMVTVRGIPGIETLLLIRGEGQPGYLLDGPFQWPPKPSTYTVHVEWLKTLTGHSSGPHSTLTFVTDSTIDLRRVTCEWLEGADWECRGVPLSAAGVVVRTTAGRVSCSIPRGAISSAGVEATTALAAAGGRLVIATATSADGRGSVRFEPRRLHVPGARPFSERFEETRDERIRVAGVAPGLAWVSWNEPIDSGWVEASAAGYAAARVDVADLANGPPEIPLRVQLQQAASIFGRVLRAGGHPVADAIVTSYRFAEDAHAARSERRVAVGETRTDGDGAYRFDNLSLERYEILAFHPVAGRGSRRTIPDGQEIDITLRGSGQIVGRVLRDDVPAEGVQVVAVPGLAEFANAADISELRGGETKTDIDGRFVVGLPARGAGELRVGDERTGVKRVPIGAADRSSGTTDVGDISLDTAPPVTIVFEGAGTCDLLLTGPVGRTGLSVLRASRLGPSMFEAAVPESGRWQLVAVCGGRERTVAPATVDVTPATRERIVRVGWPQ